MGMFAASNATGQLVFLPLIAQLATDYGWRMALVFVCCMLAVAGVVALLLMRDRPSDVGLPLYGETAVAPPPAAGVGLVSLLLSPLVVLKDAARRADLLDAVRHVLRLRLQHQRADPDPFRHAVPRLRPCGRDRGERARHDGLLRFLRHHRVGLAVRPLRSALAVVLVLRLARAVAALSAVHRFHLLRPVVVRSVLRPRLDRDRAADREAHRRPVRARKGRHRVRLGFCRPPDRRRQCGLRRRAGAHGVFHLSAGVLCRRRALPHRGGGGDLGAQVVAARPLAPPAPCPAREA